MFARVSNDGSTVHGVVPDHDPDLPHTEDDIYLPLTQTELPTFDRSTQSLTGPEYYFTLGGVRQASAIGADGVEFGWTVNSLTNDQQAQAFAVAKAKVVADLAALRWEKTQTFTYDGIAGVDCSDQAQARLNSTVAGLQLPQAAAVTPPIQVAWQFTKANIVMCALADLQAFGFAMLQYIQGQFAVEARYLALIEAAATYADVEAVDIMQGWLS